MAHGAPDQTLAACRAGEGPGEFASPSVFGLHSDTLWVYDDRLQRFSYFDRTGSHVGGTRAQPRSLGGPYLTPQPRGLLTDGALLGSAIGPEDLTSMHADLTEIWGVEMDDLGVPFAVRYRLMSRGGG